MSNPHADFLRDLVGLLVEKARKAKAERDASGTDYELGQLMAYYETVSLIQQQAEAFDLSFEDIGMPAIDPEAELL